MEVKQRGTALGHKIILFIYNIFGYRFVVFILNFVALYYVLFTPSVRRYLQSYYDNQGMKLTNKLYFIHIKSFAISIFDRFVSRIDTDELTFKWHSVDTVEEIRDGAVMLLSHVGSWAGVSNAKDAFPSGLKDASGSIIKKFPLVNMVMKENTKEDISDIETSSKRENEEILNIIDLNQGAIVANIQIANALIRKEIVGLMADRVMNAKQTVEVNFFNSRVKINQNPFKIAFKSKKTLVTIFMMKTSRQNYTIYLDLIQAGSIEEMAQDYAIMLEDMMKKYPEQWYNFYDFFKGSQ